ncbi:hypothetical protein N0V90_006415 [Kalmusia sp. IMI 367209]|nr:hypothetical protein N0V90_006415 [Kalmusia sp. IMI 367209]
MRFIAAIFFASAVLALPTGSPKQGSIAAQIDADDLVANTWHETNPSNEPRSALDADELVPNVWAESNPSNDPAM